MSAFPKFGAAGRRPPHTISDPTAQPADTASNAAFTRDDALHGAAHTPPDSPTPPRDAPAKPCPDPESATLDRTPPDYGVYLYDAPRKRSPWQRFKKSLAVKPLLDPSTLYFSEPRAASPDADDPVSEAFDASPAPAVSDAERPQTAHASGPSVKVATARAVRRRRMATEPAASLPGEPAATGVATQIARDQVRPAAADSLDLAHNAPYDAYDEADDAQRPPRAHKSRSTGDARTGSRRSAAPFSERLFFALRNLLLVAIIALIGCAIFLLIRSQRDDAEPLSLSSLFGLDGGAQSVDADVTPTDEGLYLDGEPVDPEEIPADDEIPAGEEAPVDEDLPADAGELPDDEGEYLYEDPDAIVETLPADLTPIPVDAPTPSPVPVLDREPTPDEKLAAFIYEGKDRYYTRDELIYRDENELAMIRNGMYALSGKIFERNMEAKEFFENCSWYEGTTASDSAAMSEFTYYQLQNLQLILYVEKDKGFRAR